MEIDNKTLMALRAGLKYGCWLFAIVDDEGTERVGSLRKPLAMYYKEIDNGSYDEGLENVWIAEGEMAFEEENHGD